MKVLIINIDSVIPNLALKKIEKYHKDRGDEVLWDMPMFSSVCDKIYISCVFDYNKSKCFEWENNPKAEIGGSGYSLTKELPKEIDDIISIARLQNDLLKQESTAIEIITKGQNFLLIV